MAGEKYEYNIDFDGIEAIDIHAHVEADDHGHCAYDDELITATKQYFKLESEPTTVDSVADVLPAAQHRGGGVHHRFADGVGASAQLRGEPDRRRGAQQRRLDPVRLRRPADRRPRR